MWRREGGGVEGKLKGCDIDKGGEKKKKTTNCTTKCITNVFYLTIYKTREGNILIHTVTDMYFGYPCVPHEAGVRGHNFYCVYSWSDRLQTRTRQAIHLVITAYSP